MDRQEAIDRLLDHYQQPRNHGPLADADVTMPGGQPDCGDTVTIYLKVDAASERIVQVTFEGQGCTISQAAASILTELAAGQPFATIDDLDNNGIMDLLGREVVSTRPRCATLALNTLKNALHRFRAERAHAAQPLHKGNA